MRLIQPAISKTFFEREDSRLRQAARRLSLVRDTQVARQTLLALPVSNKYEQEAVAAALTGLEAEEPQTGIDEAMRKVAVDLQQTRRSLHRVRFPGSEWNAIERGLRKIYRQGRKRMNTALEDGDDAAFHKWRIRVKNLYYELQFLEPVWRKRLKKMLSRLAELQDKIGDDHDLVVLKSSLRKTPAVFGGTDTAERVIRSVDDKGKENCGAPSSRLAKRFLRQPRGGAKSAPGEMAFRKTAKGRIRPVQHTLSRISADVSTVALAKEEGA